MSYNKPLIDFSSIGTIYWLLVLDILYPSPLDIYSWGKWIFISSLSKSGLYMPNLNNVFYKFFLLVKSLIYEPLSKIYVTQVDDLLIIYLHLHIT